MRNKERTIFGICALLIAEGILSASCTTRPGQVDRAQAVSTATAPAPARLFEETGTSNAEPSAPHIARSRIVRLNLAVLLDETGEAREPGTSNEITINLFPDITYTGVIERIEPGGDGYAWTGYLKGIEFSKLSMLLTGDVFIAQFASPEGVYEVSRTAGADLYQIILIDQSRLPGGED